MKHKKQSVPTLLKSRTGIAGFDEITKGGLPLGRTTLIEGCAGSGKTIMALQTLVNGARQENEPGIFVAFEETADRITANAAKFGWDLQALQKQKLFFLNAQPTPELFQSGSFDLNGMLAVLEAKAKEMKATRLVFDALDIVLALLDDPAAQRREVYRLHDWLLAKKFTTIITAKAVTDRGELLSQPHLGFMEFMVDCAVTLNHEVIQGISQRSLRVMKYRGTRFAENESPFLIGDGGFEVAPPREMGLPGRRVTKERVSTGIKRLDTMLGGGFYRGASVLITGFPGTAKSTLSGAFAEAACKRGERTLFVSFDSDANEVIRNLSSVRIGLERFVRKGLLRLVSARAITGNAEIHLMEIKNLAKEHGARCLVIDPISALSKAGNERTALSVAERLIDWTKASGITVVCTSLLEESGPQVEGTPLQISTIADTWIHLNYLVQAGERNRGLSIVKSRGTAHSNQVRELILSDKGVTLADAYTAGGEVLMGTLRWEKESAVNAAREESRVATKQKASSLALEQAELEARLRAIHIEIESKRAQRQALGRLEAARTDKSRRGNNRLRELRGVDTT
jgi:circadian clock protein KaiC